MIYRTNSTTYLKNRHITKFPKEAPLSNYRDDTYMSYSMALGEFTNDYDEGIWIGH